MAWSFRKLARLLGSGRLATNPYRSGDINRLNQDFRPHHYSGDSAIAHGWPLTTARTRDLDRNEPSFTAAYGTMVDHVVGTGIGVNASVQLPDSSLDDEFNYESDERFEHWCESEADAEGKKTFAEMQQTSYRDLLSAGETLWLRVFDRDPARSNPLCYQLLEPEQIDETLDRPPDDRGVRIVRGIELDKRNRVLAYWLFDAHPYDLNVMTSGGSSRVPAERILHYFYPTRSSQTRGITLFSAAVQAARDTDWLVGNTLTAAAIQALFTVFYHSGNGGKGLGAFTDGTGESSDRNGNPLLRLGRGIIGGLLGKDDKIETVSPTQPGPQLEPFIRLLTIRQAMAHRISYLRLSRDYSQTNYSSARAAHEDDDKTFRPLQVNYGNRVPRRVHYEWTAIQAAIGGFDSLSTTQFLAQRRRWQRNELMLPGRRQLDPLKETDAAIKRVQAGFSNLKTEIAAMHGCSWRHFLRQLKAEQEYAEELGVKISVWGVNTAAPADGYSSDQEDDQPNPSQRAA